MLDKGMALCYTQMPSIILLEEFENFAKCHAGLDIKHVQKQTNKALSHGGLLQHALPNRGNVRAAHTHPVQAVVVLRPGRPPFYLILRVDWSLDVFILDVLDVCKH